MSARRLVARRSAVVPLAYLLLVAVAIALPRLAGEPEAGIWAVLLALPWSFLATPLLDAVDPTLMDRGAGVAVMALGGLVNALVLHVLLHRAEHARDAARR